VGSCCQDCRTAWVPHREVLAASRRSGHAASPGLPLLAELRHRHDKMTGNDGTCALFEQGYLMGPLRAQPTLDMAIMPAYRAESKILKTQAGRQPRAGASGGERPRHSTDGQPSPRTSTQCNAPASCSLLTVHTKQAWRPALRAPMCLDPAPQLFPSKHAAPAAGRAAWRATG